MTVSFDKLKVLVVEDTAPMLKLLLYVLESIGVKNITPCADAHEAFHAYCSGEYDIVITDWMMQPLDGLDLTRKIRQSERSPNRYVPVILVTSYSSRENVQKARDEGITEFLVKPFTASDLAKRITYVMEHPRSFISTEEFFGPDRRRKNRLQFHYNGERRRKEDQLVEVELR
jgi:CheY-like chemotaxis protein